MLSSFSYARTLASFLSRGHRGGVEIHQVNPAFSSVIGRVKFMERYGLSVHQAAALVLARRFAWLFRAHPRPVGSPLSAMASACRLPRTREEACEARVDVLGRGLGSVETGACSASPAGEVQGTAPIRSGRSWGRQPAGIAWVGTRSVFPGEIPGRSRLELLGRRARSRAASSGMADDGCVTKVNDFYNGRFDGSPRKMDVAMLRMAIRRPDSAPAALAPVRLAHCHSHTFPQPSYTRLLGEFLELEA